MVARPNPRELIRLLWAVLAGSLSSRAAILTSNPAQPVRIDRYWEPSPTTMAGALTGGVVVALVIWNRERRLRTHRERLRRIYQLGEQILGASSHDAILLGISDALPGILGVSSAQLYLYNRGTKALDTAGASGDQTTSISLSSPPPGTQAGAVACFHYRTLLTIPDIDRSPFPMARQPGETPPKSLLFVPLMSQGEIVGVLELNQDDRVRDFTPDEQALAQHLGNQIGVAIRLLDQRSVQEQLFRTEKLAAVGRLISGVVNELQTPLASISDLADRALVKSPVTPAEREVSAIAAEAHKAAAIVARLVSFATADQGEAQPVCVTSLLRNLIEFRELDCKASGIRVHNLIQPEPVYVLGSHGQLEQVFLTLLVHAEQSLSDAPEKVITIRSVLFARHLLIEIAFSAADDAFTKERAAVLNVTRTVIAGHGGDARLVEKPNSEPRFEVELPLTRERSGATATPPPTHLPDTGRPSTALVIEPDETLQRQLRDLLTARGYRVVPVTNADTGLELAQRMRFDGAFCSLHAPGLNWVELSERLQARVGGFVLLSDRYDPELVADFEGEGRFVLTKPVQEPDLERVLGSINGRN
ncbi:MAG: GAF domain-containing protein [Acidobacteriia bacterium]|nr:GAF domain-containing protein [Terriglobia bacterium]